MEGGNPSHLPVWCVSGIIVLSLILIGATGAMAATAQDNGYYVITTSTAASNMPLACEGTNPPGCTVYTADGAQAYTSDYQVAQMADIVGAQDGESYVWQAVKPDGTTETIHTLTYYQSFNGQTDCFVWDNLSYFCNTLGHAIVWTGPLFQCLESSNQPTGTWTLRVIDNGVQAFSHQWSLSHGGPLGITSPTDNQLFDLNQLNYTATSSVPYIANATAGGTISWDVGLSYASSGGYGSTFETFPTFYTGSGAERDETYQSVGGQATATASTTAGDGSTISDCVTFYIDGPQSGIPDPSITSQLDGLYQGSQSYPKDGTATYNLMTGVAKHESGYHQFLYPDELALGQNPDLYNLYADYQIDAFWPTENLPNQYAGAGQYIGLMQLATTDTDAWDWTANTTDAVNLFSGTVSPNKITLASTYESDIINGVPKSNISGHYQLGALDGQQIEDMALVAYGGFLSGRCTATPSQTCLNSQYYLPSCSGSQGTIKQNGRTYLTCSTGWQWTVNTSNQLTGVLYVSNNPNAPWYDPTKQLGVRYELQQ